MKELLLPILQLTKRTIRSNSDGNNIIPKAIKRLFKYKKQISFFTRLSKVQLIILPSSALKIIHCGLGPKRLCTSALVLLLLFEVECGADEILLESGAVNAMFLEQ